MQNTSSNIQISLPSVGANQVGSAATAQGITPGSEVAISGEAVDMIVQIEVGQDGAPILHIVEQTLTFEIPKSLTLGVYDLKLVSSEFGAINQQGLIKISPVQAAKRSWTKRVGETVKSYSTMPQGSDSLPTARRLKWLRAPS